MVFFLILLFLLPFLWLVLPFFGMYTNCDWETTQAAGYTSEEGHKIGVAGVGLAPKMIIYDGDIAQFTPLRLWLSSGMRALDHAIEMLYNPRSSETPHRLLSLASTHELFALLPQCKQDPENTDLRQRLQIVAFGAFFSIGFKGPLGLSHSMGMISGTNDILLTVRPCFGSDVSDSTWNNVMSYPCSRASTQSNYESGRGKTNCKTCSILGSP